MCLVLKYQVYRVSTEATEEDGDYSEGALKPRASKNGALANVCGPYSEYMYRVMSLITENVAGITDYIKAEVSDIPSCCRLYVRTVDGFFDLMGKVPVVVVWQGKHASFAQGRPFASPINTLS